MLNSKSIIQYLTNNSVIWAAAFILVFLIFLFGNSNVRKNVMTALVFTATFLCALWILAKFTGYDDIKQGEANLLSMLLAICSGAFSWVASVFVSNQSQDTERQSSLDEIGKRSAEKVLNSSKQLFDIETYIRETVEDRSGPRDELFNTVMSSIERQISIVRTTNDTLVRDWATVASPGIKQRIEQDIEIQSELFHDTRKPVGGDNGSRTFEDRLKNAPSYYAPSATRHAASGGGGVVLSVERQNHVQTNDTATGRLKITIGRPSPSATATGHFDLPMPGKPVSAQANILSVPQGSSAADFNIAARISGNIGDFPIHIYAKSGLIASGEYSVEYLYSFK